MDQLLFVQSPKQEFSPRIRNFKVLGVWPQPDFGVIGSRYFLMLIDQGWTCVPFCFQASWSTLIVDPILESIKDKIAQAQTPIQRHMNNAWSEMVSRSPCFVFDCFSSLHWFTQTIWVNSYPSSDQHGSLILTLFFLMLLLFIFLLTTSNLMLYPLHPKLLNTPIIPLSA